MKNIVWDDDTDIKKPQNTPEVSDDDVKSYEPGRKAKTEPAASTVRYGEKITGTSGASGKLQEAINASTIQLGGGKIFRFQNAVGLYRVGFSVSGITEDEAEGLSAQYEKLCNDSTVGFLDFDRIFRVNDQWVFSFKLSCDGDNAVSVYDMVHSDGSGPMLSGDMLIKELVQILINHQSRFTKKDYQPLRCISPHTVFLVRSPRGEISVRILPLILSGNFPSQVPNDSKPDVTTDVYSACYLACEVMSGGFAAKGVAIREPSALVQKAMAPFPSWRPSLTSFAEEFEVTAKHAIPSTPLYQDDDYGLIKGLRQIIHELFPQHEARMSEKHTTTWRIKE